MNMSGEQLIKAPRAQVWTALNDPQILERCIPGCERLEKVCDHRLSATVVAKVGPVKARFSGEVEFEDIKPLEGYRLNGKGQGGIAGFAQAGAVVTLVDAPEGTILSYDVQAVVGGKLAQIGARLIDSTAKKLADQFFSNFGAVFVTQD